MFTTLVLIVHVIVCLALILIILLQTGKGADIGAAFGGGSSQTVFGSTGATPFLSKITIGAAVAFICTSIILTYFSGRGVLVQERSVVTERAVTETPASPAVPPTQQVQPEGQKAAPAGTPSPTPSPTPAQGAGGAAPAAPVTPTPGGQPPEQGK